MHLAGTLDQFDGSHVKNIFSSAYSPILLDLAYFVLFNITQQFIPEFPARWRTSLTSCNAGVS